MTLKDRQAAVSEQLDVVRSALKSIGVESMTVCDARGYARQRGRSPTYRGHEYKANLLRKVAIEVVVHEDRMDRVIEVLTTVGRTGPEGAIGDGKVYAYRDMAVAEETDDKGSPGFNLVLVSIVLLISALSMRLKK